MFSFFLPPPPAGTPPSQGGEFLVVLHPNSPPSGRRGVHGWGGRFNFFTFSKQCFIIEQSKYHRATISHILIAPPLRAYSGRGSVLFSFLVYFFYKTSFFFCGHTMACPYWVVIYIFVSLCRDAIHCVRYCFRFYSLRTLHATSLLGC